MKKKNVFRWADPTKKFIIYNLEPNEIFSGEYAYYKLDVENFNFKKLDERAKLVNRDSMQRWLDSCGIKISADEYITLLNLQDYIYMKWPNHAEKRPFREEVFKQSHCGKDNPMLLSESFNKKIAACVECSLLAQLYMQHCGIESKLCCGNMFDNPNPNIELGGGAHAYLVVKLDGLVEYIYDPVNPMFDEKGKPVVPRIMSFARVPFKDRMAFKDLLNKSVADGGGFAYVEASDIYGCGTHRLYGFESDDIENHVSRRRTADGIKHQSSNQQGSQQIYVPGGRKM